MAHRWIWEYIHGPTKLHVLHRCDNRACVRIDHLRAGTQQDNTDDAVSKKRHVFGTRQGLSKLREADVLEIRHLASANMSQRTLAKMFNVAKTTIAHVVNRRTWKHV
jgi:hypothetical protein